MTFRAQTFLLQPKASVKEVRKIINKFYLSDDAYSYATSASEQPSGTGHDSEELLVKGYYDDTGQQIIKYEI